MLQLFSPMRDRRSGDALIPLQSRKMPDEAKVPSQIGKGKQNRMVSTKKCELGQTVLTVPDHSRV